MHHTQLPRLWSLMFYQNREGQRTKSNEVYPFFIWQTVNPMVGLSAQQGPASRQSNLDQALTLMKFILWFEVNLATHTSLLFLLEEVFLRPRNQLNDQFDQVEVFYRFISTLALLSFFLFSSSSFSFSFFLSSFWTLFEDWLITARSYHQPFFEFDLKLKEELFI